MNTLILLLALTNPGADGVLPPDDGKPASAEEAARMEAFKATRAKIEARAAARESAHKEFERVVAEKEARVLAKQKMIAEKQYNLKKYGQPTKPLTVKERAAKLYAKHNPKKQALPDGPVENPFIKK